MDGCNICAYPSYACLLLCMYFNLTKFDFKFKKHFLILEILNGGGQLTITASVKNITEAVALRKLPRLMV
jgi:hypothetical protein